MIKTKHDLIEVLSCEKKLYQKRTLKKRIADCITCEPNLLIWKYQKNLRITEYYYNNKEKPIKHLLYLLYRRKKNRLGTRLGIEIWENSFEKGLLIHHAGNIVVNGNARVGKNCQLHGANCIGNSGKSLDAPIIGDNVEIGVGASIIGGIRIADNIKIGAGAVVVKPCKISNVTLIGIPAKIKEKM